MNNLIAIVLALSTSAAMVLAIPTRSSFGETAQVKSHYMNFLTEACSNIGIDVDTVESEVNQFFQCMSESTKNEDPDAPLVIPTSDQQLHNLFNFKINKNYLAEQCPTFKQRQSCAIHFEKFVKSCSVQDHKPKSPYIEFTNRMLFLYYLAGDLVCADNGRKFTAFMNETDKSCNDPNLAGFYARFIECSNTYFQEDEKTKDKVEAAENKGAGYLKWILFCIIEDYGDTCSGTSVPNLFLEFLSPLAKNQTTIHNV